VHSLASRAELPMFEQADAASVQRIAGD